MTYTWVLLICWLSCLLMSSRLLILFQTVHTIRQLLQHCSNLSQAIHNVMKTRHRHCRRTTGRIRARLAPRLLVTYQFFIILERPSPRSSGWPLSIQEADSARKNQLEDHPSSLIFNCHWNVRPKTQRKRSFFVPQSQARKECLTLLTSSKAHA